MNSFLIILKILNTFFFLVVQCKLFLLTLQMEPIYTGSSNQNNAEPIHSDFQRQFGYRTLSCDRHIPPFIKHMLIPSVFQALGCKIKANILSTGHHDLVQEAGRKTLSSGRDGHRRWLSMGPVGAWAESLGVWGHQPDKKKWTEQSMFKILVRIFLCILPGAGETGEVAQQGSCIRPYMQDKGKSCMYLLEITSSHLYFRKLSTLDLYIKYDTPWGVWQFIYA